MKTLISRTAILLCSGILLAGCRTTPAPEFNGKWQPVNRFAEAPREIPLNPAYVYYATPMDSTLKGLLTRWARDTKLGLNYGLASDYTLHAPVGQIRTSDQAAALNQLAGAYAAQRIAIIVEGGVIKVRPAAN